jgi:hypothetical protein
MPSYSSNGVPASTLTCSEAHTSHLDTYEAHVRIYIYTHCVRYMNRQFSYNFPVITVACFAPGCIKVCNWLPCIVPLHGHDACIIV